MLVLFLITASLFTVTKSASADATTQNSWVERAPMPTARGYLEVAVVNEKIYAIGGSGSIGTNEEYNPTTDNWIEKSPMPTPEQAFAIAVYQNKIYCIGGLPYGNTGVNEVYDPTTDSWETKAPMPTARYGLQANVVDGRIYLMGGAKLKGYDQGFQLLNVTEVYDPSSDKWTTKSTMPNPAGYVSAVVNNKIYVIGPGLTQIYNSETDTWSAGAQSLTDICAGGANGIAAAAAATTGTVAPKRIYVYDGSYLQVYDPQNNSWTFGADPPISRQYLGIAVVNDTLYFIGGFTYASPGFYNDYATNEQYTPFGYGTIPPTTKTEPFPIAPFVAISGGVAVIVVAAGLMFYFKKRKSGRKQ
jgi:N-acetylneuraminic acid mutarotase